MINVNQKLICTTRGALVMAMGDREVSLADMHEGLAIALRKRASYDEAIENMRTLIHENIHEENHGNE